MMSDRVIELGLLREDFDGRTAGVMTTFIDQSLVVLRDLLTTVDGADRVEPCQRIDEYRTALAGGADADEVTRLSRRCLDVCRAAIAQIGTEQVERRQEIASLIEMVREAVASVAGDSSSIYSQLTESSSRFEALSHINDLSVMKAQLASEVGTLKKLAADQKQVWEATRTTFEQRVASLETELISTQHEALLDPLTGVANRRSFAATGCDWISSHRARFVLAILDLDNFKGINDTHGHSVGDSVLVAVAQVLKASVRSDDLVARYGGDEFAILATDVTLRQALARLRSVVSTLASSSVLPSDWLPVGLTVSCGVAEYSAGDTIDSLVHRADEALYDAKRQGKNRVVAKSVPFIRDLMRRN